VDSPGSRRVARAPCVCSTSSDESSLREVVREHTTVGVVIPAVNELAPIGSVLAPSPVGSTRLSLSTMASRDEEATIALCVNLSRIN